MANYSEDKSVNNLTEHKENVTNTETENGTEVKDTKDTDTYNDCDGYWYYDGSTVYIQFGKIMGGDGSHYYKCRYKGEFKNGRATILGGKHSDWHESYSQEWVFSGDAIVVDGGSYVWRR